MDVSGLSKVMEEPVDPDQTGRCSPRTQPSSDNNEQISKLLSYLGSSSMYHSLGEDRFKTSQLSHYPALTDGPSSFTNGDVQLANGIGNKEGTDQKAQKRRPVDSCLQRTVGQTRIQKNERQERKAHINGRYRAPVPPTPEKPQETSAAPENCSENRGKIDIGEVQDSSENSQARKAFPETSTHPAPFATPVLSISSDNLAESGSSNNTIGYNSSPALSRALLDQNTPSNSEHTSEGLMNQPQSGVPYSQQVSSSNRVLEPEEPAVMLQDANPRSTGSNQLAFHLPKYQSLGIPPSMAEGTTSSIGEAHHASQIRNTVRRQGTSHIPLNADFPHATRDNPYEFQSFRHRSYGNSIDYNEYREAENGHDGLSGICYTKWLDERSKDLYQQQ